MLNVSDEEAMDQILKQRRTTLRCQVVSEKLHNEIRTHLIAQSHAALIALRNDIFALCHDQIPWWRRMLAHIACKTEELTQITNEECLRYIARIDVEYCLSVYSLGYSLTNPPPCFFHLRPIS